ncbi:MAG: hypothetical protein AAGJ83_06355, partial [Planctomycetota bacterium]
SPGSVDASLNGCSVAITVNCDLIDSSMPTLRLLVDQLAQRVADSDFRWLVSHDHDDDVATLSGREDVPSCMEQLMMACEIARLLPTELADDFDVESHDQLIDPTTKTSANWSALLEPADRFLPFPEWDELADDESDEEP